MELWGIILNGSSTIILASFEITACLLADGGGGGTITLRLADPSIDLFAIYPKRKFTISFVTGYSAGVRGIIKGRIAFGIN